MGFLAASLLMLASGATPAPDISGLWLTDDRKGLVRIEPCGTRMCGRIVRILDKRPNVPGTDVNNPDPALRQRPLLGLVSLWGFTRAGAVWKDGRAYDPQTGKSYRSTLQVSPDGSLKVTGCVLFICQSRRWTRAG
ncbi:DUF2147 domain-containing protein [Sphingobium bisphenolivorans]|uniref:DUF2147 domain-containing protein n=1 Tax=Sphingobium bisphenolivorans TaxID=1335760 RepID=UPI0003B399BE|nr:DUF2147 domain-containing protein [Sphingobium bisphenolivorans]